MARSSRRRRSSRSSGRRKRPSGVTAKEPLSPPQIFPTLISEIRSQQGLKLPVLKSLYYLLNRLSLNASVNWSSSSEVPFNCLDKKYYQCGFTVKFSEICGLSDVLFERLENRFNQLFYALRDHVAASSAGGQAVLGSNLSESIEELTLLLRCCMVILTLLVSDQNLLIQKGQVLLLILSRLISTELSLGNEKNSVILSKLVPCEYARVVDGCMSSVAGGFVALCLSGSSNPLRTVLCALLEVFADELLMQKSLREYFLLIDSASSISEMLFTCHFGRDDIGTVLEVIAAHFILSFSHEQAFEGFLNSLFWQHNIDFRIPEMSLTASLSLLLNPIMLSAPKMIQAYMILLVSEAIGIGTSSKYLKPDFTMLDCYLTAFERSIILYARHMLSFHMDDHPICTNSSNVKSSMLGSSELAFESFLQPATRNKINHLVTKFNDSWDSYVNNGSLSKKSHLVDASITYTKESLYLLDKPFGDKILSMLTSIVLRGSSDDIFDTLLYNEGTSPQEIYFLASILKLMSSSMLQAIWCLRRSCSSGCLKTLQDVLFRKKYDFLVHLIGGFRQFDIYLPIQKFVSDMMKTYPTRHKESKWMLLHFTGLLSSSYVSGHDFLVKNCIFMMMSLLNLFVFEEGDLDALSSLFNSRLESISSKSSDKIGKALMERSSSKRIASKFQKVQELYLSNGSLASFHGRNKDKQMGTPENASVLNHMDSPTGVEEETEAVCNGEIFLKCLQNNFVTSADIDDLADFIECKRGKDYSVWLKDRQRFRKWIFKRKGVNNKFDAQKRKWKYVWK